jgi:hypothetical protein
MPAPDLPPVPEHLVDEADQLINVRLNGPGNLIEKLQLVYEFLGRVGQQHVARFATCTKGCSHCCHMDVQLTAFEAEYICIATGIPHSHDAPLTMQHGTACPFLSKEGTCSIYEYRPLFCRTYHSLSEPRLCGVPGADVLQYGSVESGMGNVIYRGVQQWIYFQNQQAAGGMLKDIRDFFPHDPRDMQAHLSRTGRGLA